MNFQHILAFLAGVVVTVIARSLAPWWAVVSCSVLCLTFVICVGLTGRYPWHRD